MSKFCIYLIKIYQKILSPFLGKQCKFIPTCSVYTIEAIEEYGALKGIYLGMKRILKCNPFCKGGYDPVIRKNKKEE